MRVLSKNLESVKYKAFKPKETKQNRVNCSKIISVQYAGRQHVYDITVPEKERFVANSMIVHNCARFLYTWEVALTFHGASKIRYSNGEFPSTTNPRLVPGACKHLYRVLTFIRSSKL